MTDIDQIIATARRDSRCVSGAETRALCDEIERLRPYQQAIQSLADQIVCPKTTAEEMVRQILGEKA